MTPPPVLLGNAPDVAGSPWLDTPAAQEQPAEFHSPAPPAPPGGT